MHKHRLDFNFELQADRATLGVFGEAAEETSIVRTIITPLSEMVVKTR